MTHPIEDPDRGAAASRRAEWPAVALLFAAALGVRLLHWQQIRANDPFFAIPAVDGRVYDAWARRILAGEGLGEDVLFQGPLYPHFLAAVYSVVGTDFAALKLVQALLGALSCVLVWRVARELFESRVALVAGTIAALYGMLVFYGGTLMIVNVQVPLVLALLWAVLRGLRRPRLLNWAVAGLLLGLSALARQTTLLLAPVLVAWLLLALRDRLGVGHRLRLAAIFLGMACLLIAPFTIHNWIVGDDFVLLNSSGGANLYMGNHRRADGTWSPPPFPGVRADNPELMRQAFRHFAEQDLGRPLKASEISSYWAQQAWAEITADPARWLQLELRKLLLILNAQEVWNNRSYQVSERFSWVLRLPLIRFGWLLPLAVLGVVWTAPRWRELFPLHAVLGVYLVSLLMFFVLSRYRMPAVPVLMIFAAVALTEGFDRLRARKWRGLARALLIAGIVFAIAHLPVTSKNRMYMAYYNLGNKYKELGRFPEAVEAYLTSLEENPGFISTYNNLALVCEASGDTTRAIFAWEMVAELAKRSGDRRHSERAQRHLDALRSERGETGPASTP